MSCILLVDPSEVARKAMAGILARGKNRFAAVNTVAEAWEFIRRNVKVDLVFTELALEGDNGLVLINRLKQDAFLTLLPVVVYAEHGDRDAVKRALGLHVQNFLIKPYRDDVIHAEIARALANPWRAQHFEEEKSFCQMMGLEPMAWHRQLDGLRDALEAAPASWRRARKVGSTSQIRDELAALSTRAETAGAWGIVTSLAELAAKADRENSPEFEAGLEALTFGSQLIFRQLNASLIPEGFLSKQEANAEIEAHEAARWATAPAAGRCPVVDRAALFAQVEALSGCPVIDSTAASFQMSASGHPSSIAPLLNLVEKDPALSAELLIAIGQVKARDEIDPAPIEDSRLAVGMLGELRLATLARSLITTEERLMTVPPHFNWPQFWMFQLGTARMAQFTCHYLEFYNLESTAYFAGLLHDLGQMLLLHLHPFGLQAALKYSHERQVPLSEAERLFFGCTAADLAAHFAEKNGLARPYVNVMRWIESPRDATENAELVAIVSLARDLCRHNRVGDCGDLPREKLHPLEETAEWAVLRESVFPSFNLHEFEQKVHAECRELKLSLYGRLHKAAVG